MTPSTQTLPARDLSARARAAGLPRIPRVEEAFLPDPATRRASEAYDADPDEGADPPDRHH